MRQEPPKDGTHILAYCITPRLEGWMVIWHNGYHWQTVPGKYGVSRIERWAHLPPAPERHVATQVAAPEPVDPASPQEIMRGRD